jgi:hypothetical protein
MLNFVLSNCSWSEEILSVTYRQPFDIIAKTTSSHKEAASVKTVSGDIFQNWRAGLDSNSPPISK